MYSKAAISCSFSALRFGYACVSDSLNPPTYAFAAPLVLTLPPCAMSYTTASTINPVSLSHLASSYVKLYQMLVTSGAVFV